MGKKRQQQMLREKNGNNVQERGKYKYWSRRGKEEEMEGGENDD